MPNLYNDPQQGSAFGSAMSTAAFIGAPFAYDWATGMVSNVSAMRTAGDMTKWSQPGAMRMGFQVKQGPVPLGGMREWYTGGQVQRKPINLVAQQQNLKKYRRASFWGRARMKRRIAGQMSKAAWGGFLEKGLGWNMGARFKGATSALEALPNVLKGKAPILRALGAGPLGFLSAYMVWGAMIPAAVDLGLGIFNEMAAEGRRLRGGTPETISNKHNMAYQYQAATMRQASAAAMHMSQLSVRAAIGNEASFLH